LRACRYHSLVADVTTLPPGLAVTARTADGVVMAVADERAALYGVQFHPESILTQGGFRLLANFLERAGLAIDGRLVAKLDADLSRQIDGDNVSRPDTRVVTF
ncbi:MAG: hypothetical protein EBU59_13820, partial [Planctomycetia bacterium]|nr:hypothetical protein [Planctomycetia bacterium]